MSEREQLPCAKCGKTGGLWEEVEVETTGWRKVKVYAKDGGGFETDAGWVEDVQPDQSDVTPNGVIGCDGCDAKFDSWEEAVGDRPVEYRCAKCGWWGLQDWLHVDCDGELTEHPIPTVAA